MDPAFNLDWTFKETHPMGFEARMDLSTPASSTT